MHVAVLIDILDTNGLVLASARGDTDIEARQNLSSLLSASTFKTMEGTFEVRIEGEDLDELVITAEEDEEGFGDTLADSILLDCFEVGSSMGWTK